MPSNLTIRIHTKEIVATLALEGGNETNVIKLLAAKLSIKLKSKGCFFQPPESHPKIAPPLVFLSF